MVSSSSPPRQISRSSPASPSKTSRVFDGLSSPMIWSSPAAPCISSTRSLPKIWSLPAPASIVARVSAGYAAAVTPVSVITFAPSPPVTSIAVMSAQSVAANGVVLSATVTSPPASQAMVIASAPSPVTVSTPASTSASTAALAMPGNASAATAAMPATGRELFHFDDTGSSLDLGDGPEDERGGRFIPARRRVRRIGCIWAHGRGRDVMRPRAVPTYDRRPGGALVRRHRARERSDSRPRPRRRGAACRSSTPARRRPPAPRGPRRRAA